MIIFLLIYGSLIVGCQKGKKAQKRIKAEDIDIVINEDSPKNPSLSAKFEEDLSLTREGWWPSQILVDDKGNLFILEEKKNVIYEFDPQGNEVFRKELPKGQGPGEFTSMDLALSPRGRFYIYDQRQFRLTVMNKKYGVENLLKFGEMRWVFRLDSKENLYFWVVKFLPGTVDAQRLVLTKFSLSGELLYEIFGYIYSIYNMDGDKIEYKYPLFKPYGMFKLDSNDNLYYALSDKYEINITTQQGKLFRKITKSGSSRKVTEMDINKAMGYFPWSSRPRNEIVIPSHMPYIADFFILENDYLLVITFGNDFGKLTLAGELFDKKGIFQSRIEVPKYYRWFELVGPGTSDAFAKGDSFYTIETDNIEENFYIKRYKVIWE